MKASLLDYTYLILPIGMGIIIGFIVGMIGTVLYVRSKRRSIKNTKSASS